MLPPSFDHVLDQELLHRRQANQWRGRTIVEPIDATHVRIDNRIYINFCSNNYLGLTHHPALIRALTETAAKTGVGAGAAGLITGFTAHHASAESNLARWKQTESAILLPSGYQANHAAIQTLAALGKNNGGGVRFLLDKLSHASLIDAVGASQMPCRVFPHHGYDKLQRLLIEANPEQLQVVITESIFSMDGDATDLARLKQFKQSHPFFLLLDEAHATGVFGPAGRGYAAELDLDEIVDATIITLSKAIGCAGGAICSSTKFRDAILNLGRAYIFSTEIPPSIAAAIESAIHLLAEEPHRQHRVRQHATKVRRALGIKSPAPEDSPIIPIILGSEQAALDAAARLRSAGILAVAVRPPTVPKGSSRLRITLCSEHTDAEVDQLIEELSRLLR